MKLYAPLLLVFGLILAMLSITSATPEANPEPHRYRGGYGGRRGGYGGHRGGGYGGGYGGHRGGYGGYRGGYRG